MGFMAGIGSIFFIGRMGGGLSSSMGTGYEMTAIACAVLGGVSTNGGKGKMWGPIIATFIMAFLTYALGLMGIDPNTKKNRYRCYPYRNDPDLHNQQTDDQRYQTETVLS